MRIDLLALAICTALVTLASPAAAAVLGGFRDWEAHGWWEQGQYLCSADTFSQDDWQLRAEVVRGADAAYGSGFLRFNIDRLMRYRAARLTIDGSIYPTYLDYEDGRVYVVDEFDLVVLRALQRGAVMQLALMAKTGNSRNFQFSLYGFTAAYLRIAEECRFDPVAVAGVRAEPDPQGGSTSGAGTYNNLFVEAYDTALVDEEFFAGGVSEVRLDGYGSGDLDLRIYAQGGGVVCESTGPTPNERCRFVVDRRTPVVIRIENLSPDTMTYDLWTN